jgi:hypothetical protein
VFATFRLGVPFPRVEARLVREIPFPETMDANDSKGVAATLGREVQPALVVTDQIEALQALDEPRSLTAGNAQRAGEALEGRPALTILAIPEVLEGVFDLHTIRRDQTALPATRQSPRRPEHDDAQREQHGEDDEREQWSRHGAPLREPPHH